MAIPADSSSLIGGLASLSIVFLWLITFHKKFFESLWKTNKHNPYGTFTTFTEVLTSHFWFLVKGLFVTPDRDALEAQVKQTFLKQIGQEGSDRQQVLLTHSCRSIFYYVIKNRLDHAQETKGKAHIKIALPGVHFGSFYRMLRGIENSMDCKIEFYEIELKEEDWTLDQDSIDEDEIKKCDLILCQHLFGVPFDQNKLFELGKKFNIPILEDLVQSGSMFGKYKGNPLADVIIFSGGLDKTPQCFGAGMGFFRDSPNGKALFGKISAYHNQLPMDTWKKRFIGCFNQLLHLIIAQNLFFLNSFIGLIAYVWLSERGDYIKWYAISLKIRKSKSFAPFQHAESGFLRRPSPYQLQSMMHGLVAKKDQYPKIAQQELDDRELLLSNIPSQYHRQLFPWYTPELLQRHRDNFGIQEFSWVASPKDERMEFMIYLNNNFILPMNNTTWDFHEFTKLSVSKDLNNRLVYLPNLAHSSKVQIIHIGKALTRHCELLEGKPKQA
jgi:hypothetical protein